MWDLSQPLPRNMSSKFFIVFLTASALFHFLLLKSLHALPKERPSVTKIVGSVVRAKVVSGALFKRTSIAGGGGSGEGGVAVKGLRTVNSLHKSHKKKTEDEGLPSFEEVLGTFGVEEVSPLYLYLDKIKELIKSQWNIPPALKDRVSGLKCKILLKVRRDGEVMEKEFTLRSGDDVYDSSAMRAIEKSEPLPPFPSGIPHDEIELEVEF